MVKTGCEVVAVAFSGRMGWIIREIRFITTFFVFLSISNILCEAVQSIALWHQVLIKMSNLGADFDYDYNLRQLSAQSEAKLGLCLERGKTYLNLYLSMNHPVIMFTITDCFGSALFRMSSNPFVFIILLCDTCNVVLNIVEDGLRFMEHRKGSSVLNLADFNDVALDLRTGLP